MSYLTFEEMREQFRVDCAVSYSLTHWDEPMKLYLCGPINGCTDAEANDWRTLVKSLWPGECVDPMVRDYRGREDECVKEIVELDKQDIDGCDALIVSYDKPSVGTAMEMLYAYGREIPVVVVAAPGTKISPWLRYHAIKIVPSYQAAVDLLS